MNLKEIGEKRQKKRKETKIYKVQENNKPKFYVLDMFPYPSGAGLHVGHPKGFVASDTISRKKMLQGFNVLHPMGFDTFGLGTEQYAIQNKTKPQIVAQKNIDTYIKQLEMFGCTYDRERSFSTADPEYYRRTQRIFLQLYNHYYDEKEGKAKPITDRQTQEALAYVDYKPINRCPKCMTGLANEDLDDGKCERCGSDVEQKPMRQRVLRITKYADRLIEGLDSLNRDESMKDLERNRIGKSEGTQFKMGIKDSEDFFEVYTTRIDTVFGMSFVVMAPEHQLVDKITTPDHKDAVAKYKDEAKHKTQLERTELQKDKSGVFTGSYAINPFNGKEVPIFIADYVLANYGTGVVMAVAAHDERDYEFAQKYNLPITQSIKPMLYETNGNGTFRTDKPLVERINVGAIIKHPTEDKILLLDRKDFGRKSFIMGGAEAGETLEQAILREIKEETGYTNISSVTKLPREIETYYYAAHKDICRKGFEHVFVVQLANLDQVAINPEEVKHHDMFRVPSSEITQVTTMGHRFFMNQYINPQAYTEKGRLIDSGEFSGLTSDEAITAMQTRLQKNNIGGKKCNYKLQDRVFARQRYRGEPFPIILCDSCGVVPLKESDLPVLLPDVDNYEPTGTVEGPLADVDFWVNVPCPHCGKPAKRETNTMPGWAGSSRYWLRYMDNKNDQTLVSPEREQYWKNVDVYVGGAEHVTRHMIYARFWQKFLKDIGVVSQDEPFQKYQKVGLIMAEDGRKMSKRRGNVVLPDDVIAEYGADAFRTYEMFMGPFDQAISRSTNGIKGVKKFLDKIIALYDKIADIQLPKNIDTLKHQTIKKLTEDIDEFKFNTAISQLMIFVNTLSDTPNIDKTTFQELIHLIAPFAPHLAEEFWEKLGNQYSIFTTGQRPKYDESKLVADSVKVAVQINGKVRGILEISPSTTQDEVMNLVKQDEKLIARLTTEPKKIIYIQGKILNIVI